MAIRRLVLIGLLIPLASAASVMKQFALNDRATFLVRVGTQAPTTILFPGPIEALDSANVSMRMEDNPAVLLSHAPGAAYFTLRALKDDARAALNLLFRGRLYAITLVIADEPDRTVRFDEMNAGPALMPRGRTPVGWLSLLDRSKQRGDHAEEIARNVTRILIGRTKPASAHLRGNIEELVRFELEQAVVARIRIENTSARLQRLRTDRIALAREGVVFTSALNDVPAVIPPNSAVTCWVAVAHEDQGAFAPTGWSVALP